MLATGVPDGVREGLHAADEWVAEQVRRRPAPTFSAPTTSPAATLAREVPVLPLEVIVADICDEVRSILSEILYATAMSEGRRERLRRDEFPRLDARIAELRQLADQRRSG